MDIHLPTRPDGTSDHAWAYTGGRPFDKTRPCIVFLHGALHDHSVWTLLARWWAHHGHAVLALDQPGHGRSRGPVRADIESLADWVLSVLDVVGMTEASLVGHSMGSLIALEAAARAPERIRHLALLGTAFPMRVSDALLRGAVEAVPATLRLVNDLSISTLAAKPSCPGPGTWLHGANLALMERVLAGQPAVNLFEHDFRLCDRYTNGLAAAANARCPATLILGARDAMTPPKASADLARTLEASIRTLPCGHALMQEAPDAVLAALREALAAPAATT